MAWGSGNVGGGGFANKSTIMVTAPEGTTSVTASYGGKTKQAKLKDGLWVLSGLDYGPGVVWTVTATNGADTAEKPVPMERLEVEYIGLTYWNGELYWDGVQVVPFEWIIPIGAGGDVYKLAPHGEKDGYFWIKIEKEKTAAGFIITEPIDLTPYTTLHIIASGTNGKGGYLNVSKTKVNPQNENVAQILAEFTGLTSYQEYTLDISKLNEPLFASFDAFAFSTTPIGERRVKRMWLT